MDDNKIFQKIDSRQLVPMSSSLHDALQRLDETALGILLVVDETGHLIRTITDGDIRRLLLAKFDIDDELNLSSEQKPIIASEDADAKSLLKRMNHHGINHIPIVDQDGVPVGIAYRHDVDNMILLSSPHMGEYEKEFVAQAFDTNWIAPVGPNVDAFEEEIAELVGAKKAVALSSGTAGLHLALAVLNVGRGDTVFCSSLTFVASANPIVYQGATPVFIDSEPESWNMSPLALERALKDAEKSNQLPKAVIVVNLYGQSADFDPICELCNTYNIPVIEDAAESLGATYKDKHSGTIGRIGVYSFNGNKIITTSGGGMLVSDDEGLAEKAKFLSTQAREPGPCYHHKQVGYNYRMSNILAGIGRGQLKVLNERVDARRSVFERYRQMLADVHLIQWMPEASFGRATRWLSAALVDFHEISISVDELVNKLSLQNIEVRHLWKPMHLQPIYEQAKYYPHNENNSISDELFCKGICLPSGSNLSEDQQLRVVDALRSSLGV